MAILTRKAILEIQDIERQTVNVPEWGGEVLVRGLTGRERDLFEQSMVEMRGNGASLTLENARARLVALGCIDEDGKRIFTLADVKALGEKNGYALDRVADVVRKLSGLSSSDMQELTANFTIGRSEGSTSV